MPLSVLVRPEMTGAACFDRGTGAVDFVQTAYISRDFHGTGDLFASVLTGALVKGAPLKDAATQAAEFVRLCAEHTAPQNLPGREGIDFEPMLGALMEKRSDS